MQSFAYAGELHIKAAKAAGADHEAFERVFKKIVKPKTAGRPSSAVRKKSSGPSQ